MSDEFVETGQTFTPDGAAYCPVERKERGALGVAASLLVLVGGAAFLTYAMIGSPASQSPSATEISAETLAENVKSETDSGPLEPQIEAAASATNVEREAVPPRSAPAPAGSTEMLVAEALAESRAARAAAVGGYAFSAPTVKPRSGVYETGGDNFTPRPKPAVAVAPTEIQPVMRPTPVGFTRERTPSRATAPIYLPTEETRRTVNPAIDYARDIDRDVVNATVTIARGETFVDALKRVGVGTKDRNLSAYAFGEHYNLRRLRPGQEFKLTLGWPNQTLFQLADRGEPAAKLLSLEFRDGYEQKITVQRADAGEFTADAEPIPLTKQLHAVDGRIEGSLYLSAKAQGAPDDIIAGLADAFAYDVDFQREIFGGDEFEVIFEAQYDDLGRMASGGEIVYARLNWRGKTREKGYYRFDGRDGHPDFYDAAGQSAKRLLMKTPIDGARLSSRFGTRRHPILGYARAHKGVDFAAPRGTPIKAAGDGVVERADRYGSFGNYIRIRHANGYKTAYAHLNGFRKGIRKGKRVRQGDIIGYVGTTGRSTGPHLHYEVHLNGKAVNPQKLKIATGKQLRGAELDRFKLARDRIDAMRRPPDDTPPLYAADETPAKERL
jgi:murein DD-endopeptidase MepM/ murein hydrolase activator NlpD